jgi:hypothetical protein
MRGDDGLYSEVNLFRVAPVEQGVALGSGGDFELARIAFHPTEAGAAPAGFAVLDGGGATANLWRCVRSPADGDYCASIGQAKYGLAFASDGAVVTASYGAGYGGAHTQLRFVCDWALEDDQAVFHSAGTLADDWGIVIDVRGKAFCPSSDYTVKKMRGGAAFVIIVLGVAVLYVGGGVIVKAVGTGRAEMPNAAVWREVAQDIAAAAAFVGSCGKDRPQVAPRYEPV